MQFNTIVVGAWVVAIALAGSAPVSAADLHGMKDTVPYPTYAAEPLPHRHFYVRGDVGIGRHAFGHFSQDDVTSNGGAFIQNSFGDTIYIGAGFGWQVNPRFRFDLTGEYRSTAQVKAMDNLTAELVGPAGTLQANTLYQGQHSAYVGLLNGYWDLFNWRGFTPYVGAGIGFAHHRMADFTSSSSATFIDAGTGAVTTQLSNGVAHAHTQTNLAWALMAGTSYDISPNGKLDIGYRYLNLGSGISATTGLIDCVCGTVGAPLKVSDLEAHELRIGIRWQLGNEPRYAEHRPLK